MIFPPVSIPAAFYSVRQSMKSGLAYGEVLYFLQEQHNLQMGEIL